MKSKSVKNKCYGSRKAVKSGKSIRRLKVVLKKSRTDLSLRIIRERKKELQSCKNFTLRPFLELASRLVQNIFPIITDRC